MEAYLISLMEVIVHIRSQWLGTLALSTSATFQRTMLMLQGADEVLKGLEVMLRGASSEEAVKGFRHVVEGIDEGITRENGDTREAYIELRSYVIMTVSRLEAVEREFQLSRQQALTQAFQPIARERKLN